MPSDKELLSECLYALNRLRNQKYYGNLADDTYGLASLLSKSGVKMASSDKKVVAQRLLKMAKALVAGKEIILGNYIAVSGYSMADASASRGIRATVTIFRESRDSLALRFKGSAFDNESIHITGVTNEDNTEFNKKVRLMDEDLKSSRTLAAIVEDEMKKICKRNDKNYLPKQWALPRKFVRMNQTAQTLPYVLGRTLKKALIELEG